MSDRTSLHILGSGKGNKGLGKASRKRVDLKIQEANITQEVLDAIKGTLKSFSGAVEEAANDVREEMSKWKQPQRVFAVAKGISIPNSTWSA